MDFLDGVIVDGDVNSRSRLKMAAQAVHTFRRIHSLSSLDETLSWLSATAPVDVVFVSCLFPAEQVTKFIEKARVTPAGEDAAYVLVLKVEHQDNSLIADKVMQGAHGFLFEPYSVERVTELSALALRVKHGNMLARQRAALLLLLSNIKTDLDKLARVAYQNLDVNRPLNRLVETCSTVKHFSGEVWDLYRQLLIDELSKVDAPDGAVYTGVSARVKERMKKQLENELAAQPEPAK